jgi:hypothetical protein
MVPRSGGTSINPSITIIMPPLFALDLKGQEYQRRNFILKHGIAEFANGPIKRRPE